MDARRTLLLFFSISLKFYLSHEWQHREASRTTLQSHPHTHFLFCFVVHSMILDEKKKFDSSWTQISRMMLARTNQRLLLLWEISVDKFKLTEEKREAAELNSPAKHSLFNVENNTFSSQTNFIVLQWIKQKKSRAKIKFTSSQVFKVYRISAIRFDFVNSRKKSETRKLLINLVYLSILYNTSAIEVSF